MSRITPQVDEVSKQAEDEASSFPETPAETREGPVLDFSGKPSTFVSPALLAKAIHNGWMVSPKRKAAYFAALDKAVNDLPTIQDPAMRAKIAAMAARVLVAEQGQALRDVHHVERMEYEQGVLNLKMVRAEAGKPNDSVVVIPMTPVEELPLPDALKHYRKRVLEPEPSEN